MAAITLFYVEEKKTLIHHFFFNASFLRLEPSPRLVSSISKEDNTVAKMRGLLLLHVFFLNVFPFPCDFCLFLRVNAFTLDAMFCSTNPTIVRTRSSSRLLRWKKNLAIIFFLFLQSENTLETSLDRKMGWVYLSSVNSRRIIRPQNPIKKTDKQTDKIRRIIRLNWTSSRFHISTYYPSKMYY